MNSVLEQINLPKDLKNKSMAELEMLAQEMRKFIIEAVATKEGHLGASLGVVELTIALHYVFDTPNDRLLWDVGHQAYGHKILTGRKKQFETNRQKDGISGFPKRRESEYDAFGVGHSSTAISAALGMALAAKINNQEDREHIAVVGDASIVSGMAFEGLNHAGVTEANLLVILNDNSIGIDPSVGALKEYFSERKEKRIKGTLINALGFQDEGVVDGHDLPNLIKTLERLRDKKGRRFLHVSTIKGKGLKQAEENQILYHSPGKFDKDTGDLYPKGKDSYVKYQDVFGYTLLELARKNDKIFAITPAMPTGSSLKYMMEVFPERAIDVGIAEQHAVTLAGGLAAEGLVVFCTIYSTFLQRAYDQIIHDVALQNLPVIFCIDRAGLVGEDGATHQGVFDISFLNVVPNMRILAPRNAEELRNTLFTASTFLKQPLAIRYPRGASDVKDLNIPFQTIDFDEVICLKKGEKVAVLSTGILTDTVNDVFSEIEELEFSLFHFVQIKPLNITELKKIFKKYSIVITMEEGSIIGGFGSVISQYASENFPNVKVVNKGVSDVFVEHASSNEQLEEMGLGRNSLKSFFQSLKKSV